MTLPEVRRQLTATIRQIAELEAWHTTLTTVRRDYLLDASDTGREALELVMHGVRSASQGIPMDLVRQGFAPGRPGLHATTAQLARGREEKTLLEQQLPSPHEIAVVEQRAGQLAEEASHASAQCPEAWQRFVVALETAEISGRRWVKVRSETQRTSAELKNLVTAYELTVAVPVATMPDARETQYCELLTQATRVAACGELDVTVERDLAVMRERRTAVVRG